MWPNWLLLIRDYKICNIFYRVFCIFFVISVQLFKIKSAFWYICVYIMHCLKFYYFNLYIDNWVDLGYNYCVYAVKYPFCGFLQFCHSFIFPSLKSQGLSANTVTTLANQKGMNRYVYQFRNKITRTEGNKVAVSSFRHSCSAEEEKRRSHREGVQGRIR